MIAPINIHPPKNWQDFEWLCLKLWGEIWQIPHEIEFNSDNSQGQAGVDIYGPINDGRQYNGIQCKNKKLNLIDGSRNRISITDIHTEIEKAKQFQPALNKLIIATSLPKDQKAEEYVRQQSVENADNGLFTIQICFWDFFERKLPEFQSVYDWYLKNEHAHRVRQVRITFDGGGDMKIFHPKFQRTSTRYILKTEENSEKYQKDLEAIENLTLGEYLDRGGKFDGIINGYQKSIMGFQGLPKIEWRQLCWFRLNIINAGQVAIENYKVELDFSGRFIKVGTEKPDIFSPRIQSNVKEYSNSDTSLLIKPNANCLVQEDTLLTGNIFMEPEIGLKEDVVMSWRLLSKDFSDSGKLLIKVEPKFHNVIVEKFADRPEEVKEEKEEISLIQRPGLWQINGPKYFDKECDYHFE